MKDKKVLRLVQTALLAALTCVTTMVIQIPTGGGYLNPGDCFVQLSGWILGPWYGFIAAGLGSMLSDLFAGYAMYAPGTFLIKGLDALVSGLIFHAMAGRHRLAGSILGGAVGGGGHPEPPPEVTRHRVAGVVLVVDDQQFRGRFLHGGTSGQRNSAPVSGSTRRNSS